MALAGAVLLLSVESSLSTTTDAVDRTIADGIAQQVLDQILTRRSADETGGGLPSALGAAADELLGVGSELFDDVDDFAGYTMQPPEDRFGQPLGAGNDQGGSRPVNSAPSGFLQNWRVRVLVYYVDPIDHRSTSATATAYRAVEILVEKVNPDGRVIPLANRKRVITYIPPPAS